MVLFLPLFVTRNFHNGCIYVGNGSDRKILNQNDRKLFTPAQSVLCASNQQIKLIVISRQIIADLRQLQLFNNIVTEKTKYLHGPKK